VYLKNGSIIHGTITEYLPGESLKIQTSNKDVFVFSLDEIDKITREQLHTIFYSNVSRICLLRGEGSNLFSANIVNGIRKKQFFAIGFGVGYDRYPHGTGIPLFIDTRICPQEGSISPIVFADFGYSLLWIDNVTGSFYGGLMSNLGLGVRFRKSNSTSFIIEVGFKHQKVKEYYSELDWHWGDYIVRTRHVFYNFLSLSIGVSF
jgi:hypothetical protein